MNFIDIALCVVLLITFLLLISPPVRNNKLWSATVTPLASIIGSGFLVSVPMLASAIGVWAVLAVVGLTALAYLFGESIRFNIANAEPILEKAEAGHTIKSIETASHVVLIGAYFISVAYYLVLLATFTLKMANVDNPMVGKGIATALILLICGVGATKGLKGIERTEKYTVSANLAVIAALLVSLVIFGFTLPSEYSWGAVLQESHTFDWDTVRFLMGLVIIVQGFETTRFMGQMYNPNQRIKAMRRAQVISTCVYIVFFILMLPLFPYFTSSADVAGFIDVIKRVSPWLPYVVAAGAVASQFSASVADSIGASGLVSDTTHKHITPKHAYLLIGIVSVLVIWGTDVVSIVALASRAFALFYALQCLVSTMVALGQGNDKRAMQFGVLGVVAMTIVIFGIPAG
ncbi:hypothetical protein MACH09_44580 [Vibrio sp. MACH09]|uniref:hypothetical protein n=1 Tax=Vibrio sp. MACH09 TaxID=3025122 RepID=UPI00278D9281|nr:hypothetical protein [Vibrio sp. MACH09]GLO63950.1 hypothetical protein MACH09_44580 [Vibrio sp. MACH09]